MTILSYGMHKFKKKKKKNVFCFFFSEATKPKTELKLPHIDANQYISDLEDLSWETLEKS